MIETTTFSDDTTIDSTAPRFNLKDAILAELRLGPQSPAALAAMFDYPVPSIRRTVRTLRQQGSRITEAWEGTRYELLPPFSSLG